MVIIVRYIFKGFISIFLFCTVMLWLLYIIGDIFGFLDEILREHISAVSLWRFYIFLTPFILVQMIPIAILIACVYLFGNLNRHSEITALRASGISIWRILSPILTVAFILSLVVFILNDKLLPPSMRMANRIRYEKLDVGKRRKSQGIVLRNVAIYGRGNRIIFAKAFDIKKNVLKEVIVHQHDLKNDLVLKLSAQKIYWIDDRWRGEDVVLYRMNNKGEFIGEPVIAKQMDVAIAETPTDFINNQWKPEFMSFMQLKRYMRIFAKGSKKTYVRFLVDLNYKVAFPFACITMILISAPFAFSTKRGGALLGMAKGIVVALLYIPVMAIGLALGKGGVLPPALGAWFGNLLFGGIGVYLLGRF